MLKKNNKKYFCIPFAVLIISQFSLFGCSRSGKDASGDVRGDITDRCKDVCDSDPTEWEQACLTCRDEATAILANCALGKVISEIGTTLKTKSPTNKYIEDLDLTIAAHKLKYKEYIQECCAKSNQSDGKCKELVCSNGMPFDNVPAWKRTSSNYTSSGVTGDITKLFLDVCCHWRYPDNYRSCDRTCFSTDGNAMPTPSDPTYEAAYSRADIYHPGGYVLVKEQLWRITKCAGPISNLTGKSALEDMLGNGDHGDDEAENCKVMAIDGVPCGSNSNTDFHLYFPDSDPCSDPEKATTVYPYKNRIRGCRWTGGDPCTNNDEFGEWELRSKMCAGYEEPPAPVVSTNPPTPPPITYLTDDGRTLNCNSDVVSEDFFSLCGYYDFMKRCCESEGTFNNKKCGTCVGVDNLQIVACEGAIQIALITTAGAIDAETISSYQHDGIPNMCLTNWMCLQTIEKYLENCTN